MSLDLSAPIREAIINASLITDRLGTYAGEPSIHTRRPVPSEATYPMVVVSPNISLTDFDALTGSRPLLIRDVTVYGQNQPTDMYRIIEDIGYELRFMFHRQKRVITVEDYHVVDIVASGPIPAPTDDEKLMGRAVTLTIRLQRNP